MSPISRREIQNIIALPCVKSNLYATLMSGCVLEAKARQGNFHDILKELVDCRMHVALITGDDNVTHSLADFGFSRSRGMKPEMQSFSSIKTADKTQEPLSRMIESRLFCSREKSRLINEDDTGARIFAQSFALSGNNGDWTYRIKKLVDGTIEIHHAFNREVPHILRHLNDLWDAILTTDKMHTRHELLLAFEWWFFTTNVTARSGAGIGDALSLILRLQTGIPVRKQFERIDWKALSSTLPEYVAWRSSTIASHAGAT
jgi:hypothetical protein